MGVRHGRDTKTDTNGKRTGQAQFLKYTADAQRLRVRGGVNFDRRSVPQNRAIRRLMQTIEHTQTRRFAGAVLTAKSVNLPGAQVEIDTVQYQI